VDGLMTRAFMRLSETVDRRWRWHRLPRPLALATLTGLRMMLRRTNLYAVDGERLPWAPAPLPPDRLLTRRVDGSDNDGAYRAMGSVGTPFGRNVAPDAGLPTDVLTPNPRVVSRELLTRERFQPATTLNVLAAAWLQFQVHDWLSHETPCGDRSWLVDIGPNDPWPERPMRIGRTPEQPTSDGKPPTYANTETHWWDASQVYGANAELQHTIRAHRGGRLLLSEAGLVPFDPTTMRHLAGVNGNWWVGLALMHTLFMREHNAICGRLAAAYPAWGDDDLFEHARLVNAALIAKIHTVEWTTALLATRTMRTAMAANWWGLMGERFTRRFGRISRNEEISGIPGSPTHHHGVPYAMTEEFVAVYRMHPLMPDDYRLRALSDDRVLEECGFPEIALTHTHEVLERVPAADLLYSFGTSHPGAIVLHNFPKHLQAFQKADGTVVDVAAVDLVRNRERGVPRYNEFRRRFHLAPAATFDDFSDDPAIVADLRRIYGDPDAVDLMVGLYAEKPPAGFAFSDTAFRVFLLMASRRLKSDRFFTYDYRPEVYTPEGLDWIATNTMTSVLVRHYPALTPALAGTDNAFAPWSAAPYN
jgi:hypothetical protein